MSASQEGITNDVRRLGDFSLEPRTLLIVVLALPVGALSAGVAFLLLRLIGLITNLVFYGRAQTSLVAPGAHHHSPLLVLLAPVIGGLVIGLMARYGSEKIRGHGMPETIESILIGGSRVQPRVALLKPVSAAISIGTGGPFGAEGPIIMTGGAFGSLVAQFLELTADERKTLLVAGAAGGMAATFNAPLASVLLAVELLLFEWRPRSFLPVVASVAVATVLRKVILGGGAIFLGHLGTLHLTTGVYGGCLIAGVLGGGLALVATGLIYASEDAFERLPIHWMWWPAIGGLIIGVGGLFEPRALGVGYDVIRELLRGQAPLSLIIGILVVKTLIWSLSLGSGTSGGVLAPTFMIGAALGALEAHVLPGVAPGFWSLVGLAAVVGGVMRAPLTGVVFSLELTHDWGALLPLLIASAVAYCLSALLLKRSVLSEKIARRGHHMTREYSVDPLEVLLVRDVMQTEVLAFSAEAPVAEVASGFLAEDAEVRDRHHRQRLYPVLEGESRLVGVVTRRDMLAAALGGAGWGSVGVSPEAGRKSPDPSVFFDPVRTGAAGGANSSRGLGEVRPGPRLRDLSLPEPVVAYADLTLREAANLMAAHSVTRLPVVRREEPTALLGIVTLVDLLAGRLHDLKEERDAERILRLRLRVRDTDSADGVEAVATPAGVR